MTDGFEKKMNDKRKCERRSNKLIVGDLKKKT